MYSEDESAAVLTHQPCPLCGSHDAAALYSDGHLYCFSCQGVIQGGTTSQETRHSKMPKALIQNLNIQALPARSLTLDTCQKFDYAIAHEGDNSTWQVATYRDHDGNPAAQHLRGRDKVFRWRGNVEGLQLYGQHLWRTGGKMIIVTEGEIDCLTVSQVQGNKWPVVSIPNGVSSAPKAFKDNIEWLETFEKVVICFDMDEPGQKAAQQVAQLLSPGKAYIMQLPLKDPNDMLKAGKVQELINAIWQSAPYRPDGIVSGADLWDELIKPPEPGYTTLYPQLDTMTAGIRKRELWLFTAGSGIGKSTIVHEIAYHLMMTHNLKIGIMALEESKRRAAERYLSIHLNKPLHLTREGITQEQLRQAYEETIGKGERFFLYDHFGSTDIDTLMGKIRYLAVSCGIDFLVLDHISIVVSGLKDAGDNERKQIDLLMTSLRSLVEETGIGVLGVVHLKRPEKGESWNAGKKPSLTDLRGSGGLEQLSDTVIALSRNQNDEDTGNTAQLTVLKNRHTGITGDADQLQYDNRTGRLTALPKASPFDKDDKEEQNSVNQQPMETLPAPEMEKRPHKRSPVKKNTVGKTEKSVQGPVPLDGETDF